MVVLANSILLILLIAICSLEELVASSSPKEKLTVKRRLQLLNKPAIKSFTTKHGDILDCVEIDKQLAFDHPLLKNHSIQMKPSQNGFTKFIKSKQHPSLEEVTPSQLLPSDMICPQGTVMVKRITEEDLVFEKMTSSPLLGKKYFISNSSTSGHLNDAQTPVGAQAAALVALRENSGLAGQISIWGVDVTPDQYSSAFISVQSEDGEVVNAIQAGWIVLPWLYNAKDTRFHAFWTKDSGKKTGCFNALCPGFVQTSQRIPLGLILDNKSTYEGKQYFMDIKLTQDAQTKNWMLILADENIGYWPKELFSSLADGGKLAEWGGQIFSPKPGPAPAMGSGHFPKEGFGKASFIMNLDVFGVDAFPRDDLKYFLTKPQCYLSQYMGRIAGQMGQTMYFGGPPNCS